MSSSPPRRSVVVATLDDNSITTQLAESITKAVRETIDQVTIFIVSERFAPTASRKPSWSEVQDLLTSLYILASKEAQSLDKVLLDINVVLKSRKEPYIVDLPEEARWDYVQATDALSPEHFDPIGIETKVSAGDEPHPQPPSTPPHGAARSHPVVVLGGTFDHLHAGHKLFLSMAAWIASDKLIVGVTSDKLLVNKKHKEVLENIETRKSKVAAFIWHFRPDLEQEIVEIEDVYGPTGTDPNIQALVVTPEPSTLSGADMIDALREEKGLPKLQRYIIDVIPIADSTAPAGSEDAEAALKRKIEGKMSSTYIRGWIAKNRT